ncbi:MAG: malto-oligosyltrehalose synthase [Chloroflexi bacterium]|nr:malto-oligosyltrehalose synthase [Chloroflexota bacterium]
MRKGEVSTVSLSKKGEVGLDQLVDRVNKAISGKRYPVSTYRLQFNRFFTFRQAGRLAGYLDRLGVTDIYASPYLKACAGSSHGYDITDHNALNPEIGSKRDYVGFVRSLKKRGMGQVLDFVPNHMSLLANPWFADVMENGVSSPYARFFDIEWYPIRKEMHQKVMLPILEDRYGRVLAAGELRVILENGAFYVVYRGNKLPLDPQTLAPVVALFLRRAPAAAAGTACARELEILLRKCGRIPARNRTTRKDVELRYRQAKIIKKRMEALWKGDDVARQLVAAGLEELNGRPGDFHSFDQLHSLLEAQAYRLSFWRAASDEINYRRFFEINDLVALNVQLPQVFRATHEFLRKLLRDGMIDGVRLDHVDGLFDPLGYYQSLQRAYLEELRFREMERASAGKSCDDPVYREQLMARTGEEKRPLFIVAEKILGEKESLRECWPVDGTTGYEFGMTLNGVFINRPNLPRLRAIYRRFTGINEEFKEIAYRSKSHIMNTSMAAELNVLADQLDRVAQANRLYRDFTLNSLRDGIREVIAVFPVYRTYINAFSGDISDEDKATVNAAVAQARRRNPTMGSALFDFIRDTLLCRAPQDATEGGSSDQQLFVMRFQQLTGPVMAKGVEDTAFYVYNPLVSLNDVGGNPGRLPAGVDEFHRQNYERRHTWPHTMVSTSTHDSKRSEDVRARINVLSELPAEWKAALTRWSRLNGDKRVSTEEGVIPSRNEEYLIYQTLLGTYPAGQMAEQESSRYQDRIKNYMLKAMKEAKVHTSWAHPNEEHEKGVLDFISRILDPAFSEAFLSDFQKLNHVVTTCGKYNSLSQVVLKLLSPGIPDIYQGNELWDFSLVDPDNRRPVDFDRRVALLRAITKKTSNAGKLMSLARELAASIGDDRAKLFVTQRCLTYRRQNRELFDQGIYIGLDARGVRKRHICAFAWYQPSRSTIVVTPRLMAKLTQNGAIAPVGTGAWGNTQLLLPRPTRAGRYRNILTGEIVHSESDGHFRLPLAEVFTSFPVAVLETGL